MDREGSALTEPKIIEQGVDTRELFRIEISNDGYFAVRDKAPKFALHAPTIEEAAARAARALDLVARLG